MISTITRKQERKALNVDYTIENDLLALLKKYEDGVGRCGDAMDKIRPYLNRRLDKEEREVFSDLYLEFRKSFLEIEPISVFVRLEHKRALQMITYVDEFEKAIDAAVETGSKA